VRKAAIRAVGLLCGGSDDESGGELDGVVDAVLGFRGGLHVPVWVPGRTDAPFHGKIAVFGG
jgi:hypothetical protein